MASSLVLKSKPSIIINHIQRRFMPVNVPPTATGKRRFRLAVETDPHKLVNYCCGINYHKDEQPIKLKPDEEYPDWLWSLRLGPKPNSYELEEGTKEYYLTLAQENADRNYKLKLRGEPMRKVVAKDLLFHQEYMNYKRFAALAFLEDDIGLPVDLSVREKDIHRRHTTWASDYYLPVNEKKVIYMDDVEGNSAIKNYYYDPESTFGSKPKSVVRRPGNRLKAFQDSKQRHRHSVF